MAKVLRFRKKNKRPKPLTDGMVRSLRKAYKIQRADGLFGPRDIGGSFLSYINRDLNACKIIDVQGNKEMHWYVTEAGIIALDKVGIRCM